MLGMFERHRLALERDVTDSSSEADEPIACPTLRLHRATQLTTEALFATEAHTTHSQHSRPTGVALAPEQAAQNAGSSPPAATHRGPHSPLSSSPPRLPTVPQGAASPSCSK